MLNKGKLTSHKLPELQDFKYLNILPQTFEHVTHTGFSHSWGILRPPSLEPKAPTARKSHYTQFHHNYAHVKLHWGVSGLEKAQEETAETMQKLILPNVYKGSFILSGCYKYFYIITLNRPQSIAITFQQFNIKQISEEFELLLAKVYSNSCPQSFKTLVSFQLLWLFPMD